MVGRSAGSVPSASGSYSERSALDRLMSNHSWIHIYSRRGHPKRIAPYSPASSLPNTTPCR
jgi:hypothetical protein